MNRTLRTALVTIGALLIGFGGLAALYAGEPFNIATVGALIGIGLIVWAVRTA